MSLPHLEAMRRFEAEPTEFVCQAARCRSHEIKCVTLGDPVVSESAAREGRDDYVRPCAIELDGGPRVLCRIPLLTPHGTLLRWRLGAATEWSPIGQLTW